MSSAYLFELDAASPALPQVRAQIDRQLRAQWPPDLRRLCREFLAEWRFAEATLIAEALDREAGLLDEPAPAPPSRLSQHHAPLRRRPRTP